MKSFKSLSAACDHVWVKQQGFEDATAYKKAKSVNKVPSGGGWKFWGILPGKEPEKVAPEKIEEAAKPEVAAPAKPALNWESFSPSLSTVPQESLHADSLANAPKGTQILVTLYDGQVEVFNKLPWSGQWHNDKYGDYDNLQLANQLGNLVTGKFEVATSSHIGGGVEPLAQVWTEPGHPLSSGFNLVPLIEKPSVLFLMEAPIGAALSVSTTGGSDVFQKVAAYSWQNLQNPSEYYNDSDLFHNVISDSIGVSAQGVIKPTVEAGSTPVETFNTKPSVEEPEKLSWVPKKNSPQDKYELDSLPVGHQFLVDYKGEGKNAKTTFTKQANGMWADEDGSEVTPGFLTNHLKSGIVGLYEKGIAPVAEPVTDPESPGAWKAHDQKYVPITKLETYPAGTELKIVFDSRDGIYTKQKDGSWDVKYTDGDYFQGKTNETMHSLMYYSKDIQSIHTWEAEKPKKAKKAPKTVAGKAIFNTEGMGSELAEKIQSKVISQVTLWHSQHANDNPDLPVVGAKPTNWPAWVPPPGVLFQGEENGEKYYALVAVQGHTDQGTPSPKITFGIFKANGEVYVQTGPSTKALDTLSLAAKQVGIEHEDAKAFFGLDKTIFVPGETFVTVKDGIGSTAVAPKPAKSKPIGKMTKEEKVAPVKVEGTIEDALAVHDLAKKYGSDFIVKGSDHDPGSMIIQLNGSPTAGEELMNLAKQYGFADKILNMDGQPYVAFGGAHIAVPKDVLKQSVAYVASGLDAHGKGEPKASEPTKPSKPYVKSPEQIAKEQKVKEVASWAKENKSVSDTNTLQALGYMAEKMGGAPKLIVRQSGENVLVEASDEIQKLPVFQKGQEVDTPLGKMISVPASALHEAFLPKQIEGPDGKQYPEGTTFKTETLNFTAEELIKTETGFNKIVDHANDPTLSVVKFHGVTEENQKAAQDALAKFGLSGTVKVGSGNTLVSVPKASLAEVKKTETSHTPKIPKQPPLFSSKSLPYFSGRNHLAVAESQPEQLDALDTMKIPQAGHAIMLGKPGILRDFQVHVRKVKDPKGKLHYVVSGQLCRFDPYKTGVSLPTSEVYFPSCSNEVKLLASNNEAHAHQYDEENGYSVEQDIPFEKQKRFSGYKGQTDGGSEISVFGEHATFDGTFTVRIPEGSNVRGELENAFTKMGFDGKEAVAPMDADSLRVYKKWAAVRSHAGAHGWKMGIEEGSTAHDEKFLDGKINSLKIPKHEIDAIEFKRVSEGAIAPVLNDGKMFKDAGWRGMYRTDKSANSIIRNLLHGNMGWISRKQQYLTGTFNGYYSGWSASSDISTGGATGNFFRVFTNPPHLSNESVVVHPRCFERGDWWRATGDVYGTIVSPGSSSVKRSVVDAVGSSSGNEICFQGGTDLEDVLFVTLDKDSRKTAITLLKKKGIHEVNGRPIEDFIVATDDSMTHKKLLQQANEEWNP